MTRRQDPAAGIGAASPAGGPSGTARFTAADAYRTVTSAVMVAIGAVILVRTLAFGFHLVAVLVGLGFMALGAYRIAFVVAYLRRARAR